MEWTTLNLLIIASTIIVLVGLLCAAFSFVMVGRSAFHLDSPSSAGAFGLLFLALPTLSTIVLIVIATTVLTAMGILKPEGCIAIFSSVASFVLGAESQRRRTVAAERTGDHRHDARSAPPTPEHGRKSLIEGPDASPVHRGRDQP